MKFLFGRFNQTVFIALIIGVVIGLGSSYVTVVGVKSTSDEFFCTSCHSMKPMALAHQNEHHGGKNRFGFKALCTDCHLPHDTIANYMFEKTRRGIHDVLVEVFRDTSKINWEAKRKHREDFVYDSGCMKCHTNLQTATQVHKIAFYAHKPYFDKTISKKCVSCHQNVGHKDLGLHLVNKTEGR